MKRCGIYVRVSTTNHGQDVDTQLFPLREFAKNRGFIVYAEYADKGVSGSKERRPQLDQLMKDARARKIDVVLVFRFDRFARSSRHLAVALEEFNSLGVAFISLNEGVDTTTSVGKMIFTVLGAVAELERDIIRERVMAGLDRARKQKKQLGRPRRVFDREKAIALHQCGKSVRDIAAQLGVGKDTIHSAIRAGR